MHPSNFGRLTVRLFLAVLVATAVSVAACNDSSPAPVAPSPVPLQGASTQTLTINANGVFPSIAFVDADSQLRIVNNDTVAHFLHLDSPDQTGCGGFDLAGEVPPGGSRLTGQLTQDSAGCDVHDHDRHGDRRFMVQIVVGDYQ